MEFGECWSSSTHPECSPSADLHVLTKIDIEISTATNRFSATNFSSTHHGHKYMLSTSIKIEYVIHTNFVKRRR